MMRRRLASSVALSATSLCLGFVATNAGASVTEPNGLVVPGDSSIGSEIQLSAYFSSVGDAIDEKVDAHTTPDTFSPLCGFTGEFVLNQAGSHFGVGWYNVDPAAKTPPPASAIHVITAAGAPVGTKFSGTDIRKDPAYTGGAIGFALIGGQIHYSEQKWNVVCTSCSPATPWVLSLTYQSKKTPNAYYLGFEDGNVDGSSFANDGDFNDDVFLFTGLVCAASGKACDTGKKGICAFGSISCVDGKELCKDAVLPGAKQCNGLDNDCDGKLDDGPCPDGTICTKGACIPKCGTGEFKCSGGTVCDAGICVEASCVGKTCPDGTTCVAGTCVDACTGVKCPTGLICRVGVCVDPCASLACGSDEVCEGGLCKPGCACAGCPTGSTCDATSKKCLPAGCAAKTCPAGSHCESGGTCVDSCVGVTCPKGQTCALGVCKASVVAGDGGLEGGVDDAGDGGVVFPDGGFPGDDSSVGDASSLDSGGGTTFGEADKETKGACSCSMPGSSSSSDASTSLGLIALAGLALGVCRRPRGQRR